MAARICREVGRQAVQQVICMQGSAHGKNEPLHSACLISLTRFCRGYDSSGDTSPLLDRRGEDVERFRHAGGVVTT